MPEKTNDKPDEPEIPRTWRRDVYVALADINLGFEKITAALKVLQAVELLEDFTEADMFSDLDDVLTGINYVVLSELHASEAENYRAIKDEDEPAPKYRKRTCSGFRKR